VTVNTGVTAGGACADNVVASETSASSVSESVFLRMMCPCRVTV
jgi:hypothetical protein